MKPVSAPHRLLILAPNWLGDAVMALPLIADLRRAWPQTTIAAAARAPVAAVFAMVPPIDERVVLEGGGGWRAVSAIAANAARLAQGNFDAALLLPNSFLSALLVQRAGIPERWGFVRDMRGRLLTRGIPHLRRYGHQVEYYQALAAGLGLAAGEPYAGIVVPGEARSTAASLLSSSGVEAGRRFVVMAPGAAYGRAKQWVPERFAELAAMLAREGTAAVLVGTQADRATCQQIARLSPAIDLSGRTDLVTLAAILATADHVVANDSGAMHLAAAAGASVTAIFGPTDDAKTSPLRASAQAPAPTVVTTDVWCRPCMLRECPIDHRCMTRISATRVYDSMRSEG